MTTFERPDATLLVEQFLPSLLGASQSLTQAPQDRALFFGELGTALENLRGRLTVISSPQRIQRENEQYPWLWRYVSHFTVGAESRAVQHSKLWAFHWKFDNKEQLDLHVSSTNLTRSAFTEQMQAGWTISVPLDAHKTRRKDTWGKLVPFLDALGKSTGAAGARRIERLQRVLARAQCPGEISFVASIPGKINTARQLNGPGPKTSAIHVLTPTVGEWNRATLDAWCSDIGVSPNKLHLKWIAKDHPWAGKKGWSLSETASSALQECEVRMERLPAPPRFTAEHREEDERWSHAKLYLFRRARTKYRLLVTSANWSIAAWGAGKIAPRNFELGVAFDASWVRLESINRAFDSSTTPFYAGRAEEDDEQSSPLEWAQAVWDGRSVELQARTSEWGEPIVATVKFTQGASADIILENVLDSPQWRGCLRWTEPTDPPITALFSQGNEKLSVDVIDVRKAQEFRQTPLPEIDPDQQKALREAFLLERYGGLAIDVESQNSAQRRPPSNRGGATDYSVQAWLDARDGFRVVDSWRSTLRENGSDPHAHEDVRMDGEELYEIFGRREGPAARLVAEELNWRLAEEE